MCQIESPEGVENIEKTAAVEGVDCLFIGPNDLTQSYGIMGQTQNPIFIDAVKRVIAAAKAEKKACGIHLQNTDGVKKWMAEGMNMNLYGNDASLLKNACAAGVSAIRGE
jgi:2-keto-3-deoxy-L-rhamnonate aldolase RhmA